VTSSAHQRHRVRVWVDEFVIAEYVAEQPMAARYEQAMRRRYAGFHVTNEPLDSSVFRH
jgi:hypothetical protein